MTIKEYWDSIKRLILGSSILALSACAISQDNYSDIEASYWEYAYQLKLARDRGGITPLEYQEKYIETMKELSAIEDKRSAKKRKMLMGFANAFDHSSNKLVTASGEPITPTPIIPKTTNCQTFFYGNVADTRCN